MLLVSVFVQYDEWGRMGNRMFQYAFGYIISKSKNCNLYALGLPNFGIKNNASPVYPVNPIYTASYGNNYVDLDELLKTERDIVINSYVQKYSYYSPFINELKSVFKVDNEKINTDKLILHVRETDYVQLNTFLGYDFYKKLIDDSGFKDVVIVTDNSNCDAVKRLLKDGCTINTEGYVGTFNSLSDDRGMKDFNTLLKSANIAISQSSFSWWAAFLGNHDKVYMPYTTKKGMWKLTPEKDDINLYIEHPKTIKYVYDV
jgi:hypothetical protein